MCSSRLEIPTSKMLGRLNAIRLLCVIAFFPVTPRIDLFKLNRAFHGTRPTRTWLTKKYNRRKSSFQITIALSSSRRRLARRRPASSRGLGFSAPKNLILLIGGADRLDEKL